MSLSLNMKFMEIGLMVKCLSKTMFSTTGSAKELMDNRGFNLYGDIRHKQEM